MNNLIFDIKRYAINDGPGIRTTIFLKGCPLRCVWCHNPEGWTTESQLLYKRTKCIGCRTCVEACPQQALTLTPDGITLAVDRCIHCGRCAEECPTTALEMCGREWTLDALMAEIEKERDVMQDSGGGVTLCGGEPLMHADYILPLLQELGHRGFHRAVDTTLHAPWQTVARVAAECDLWLVDLKLMDSAKHQQYTGVANELILENLRRLAQSGARILIRIPLIEGINADEENIAATARFLSTIRSAQSDAIPVFHTPTRSLSLAENSQSSILNSQFPTVHLLPYHDVGKDKHRRMWSRYNPQHIRMESPSEETIQRCAAQLNDSGLHVVIGG